jgi:hypothetical protein
MHHMAGTAREDEGGECRRHAGKIRIDASLSRDPAIDGVKGATRRVRDAQLRKVVKAVDEGADRGFRGFPAAFVTAKAISDRRDDFWFCNIRAPMADADIILIFRPSALLRGKADLDP